MVPMKYENFCNLVFRCINKGIQPYLILYQNLFTRWFRDTLNSVDEDRLKQFGPDRVCAEWLIRNGAQVKLKTLNEFISLYEEMPSQDSDLVRDPLVEASAVNVDLTYVGFDHFKGCNHLKKIVFNSCKFVDDRALSKLVNLKDCLEHLEIISCNAASDAGIMSIADIRNLRVLVLQDLPGVKNKTKCETILKTALPGASFDLKM